MSVRPQSILLPKEEPEKRSIRAQKIATFLTALNPKRPWKLTIEPFKRERTNQQNRYLRGVCAKLLSEAIGYEVDEVYEYLLGTYFGWKQEACPKTPSNPKGIKDVPVRSTTKNENGDKDVLNKQDFWDFVEWIQRFGAKHNVMIPDPDPNYFMRDARQERAAA